MKGAVVIPQDIPGKIYKVVTTDFAEGAPVQTSNCNCKNLNGKVYNNTPVIEVVQDVVSVLQGTYNYSGSTEFDPSTIDIEQYVAAYIQNNLPNDIEMRIRNVVSPAYVLSIFNNMSTNEIKNFTSILSTAAPEVIELVPGNTTVKYTATAELPDWEGLIVGQLTTSALPNYQQIKEVYVGTSISSMNVKFGTWQPNYLTKVNIPNNVSSLVANSFSKCYNLISVNMSDSLRVIKESTFTHCINLKNINIPSNLEIIQDYAFSFCSSMTSVALPNTVETIGAYAFNTCKNLSSITLGDNVLTIGAGAFMACSKLSSITLPATVYRVDADAFRNSALTSITLLGHSIEEATAMLSSRIPDGCQINVQ